MFDPYDASTVLVLISVNLVGKLPEFIKSTNKLASSSEKFPCITTLLENASFTVAAEIQLLPLSPHLVLLYSSPSYSQAK